MTAHHNEEGPLNAWESLGTWVRRTPIIYHLWPTPRIRDDAECEMCGPDCCNAFCYFCGLPSKPGYGLCATHEKEELDAEHEERLEAEMASLKPWPEEARAQTFHDAPG